MDSKLALCACDAILKRGRTNAEERQNVFCCVNMHTYANLNAAHERSCCSFGLTTPIHAKHNIILFFNFFLKFISNMQTWLVQQEKRFFN